jgi:hypothetical protein
VDRLGCPVKFSLPALGDAPRVDLVQPAFGEPFVYCTRVYSLEHTERTLHQFVIVDRETVDAAQRRRFYFTPFFPDEPPVEGLLRRWLEKADPSLLWVANVVDEANRRLGDRQVAIGPSYFLREDLTEEWVGIVWEHAVLPYLSEQFFDEEERLAEFDLRLS